MSVHGAREVGRCVRFRAAVSAVAFSQLGPRLLRNFMRDTANQVVLGTFVATFVYCLLILRSLRRPGAYRRRRPLHARNRSARDVADRESLHEYGEDDDAVSQ